MSDDPGGDDLIIAALAAVAFFGAVILAGLGWLMFWATP